MLGSRSYPPNWRGRAIEFAIDALGIAVAILLAAMMLLTFVDVVGRYFFNNPVQGSYELTEVLLPLMVFAGLPLTTLRDEHVTVSLFDGFFRGAVRKFQQLGIGLLSTVVLGVLAWRLWDQAQTLAMYDDKSLFLEIPYAWVAYFMTVMAVVSTIITLLLTVARLLAEPDNEEDCA